MKKTTGVVLGVLVGLALGVGERATGEVRPGGRRDKTREREFMRYIESVQAAIDLYIADRGEDPLRLELNWVRLQDGGYITTWPYNWAMPWGTAVQRTSVAASDSANFGWTWDRSTRTISATYFDEENLEFLGTPH